MASENKRFYTEKEAAQYTGLSLSELRRWRNSRAVRFGVKRYGKSITYKKEDLDKAMEANYQFYEANKY